MQVVMRCEVTRAYIKRIDISGQNIDHKYMPYQAKIFRLPAEKEELLAYTNFYKERKWRYTILEFKYTEREVVEDELP